MKLRYCLYLLKAPRFPDDKLPSSFGSLPKSFDRDVFQEAIKEQKFEDPILIATSDIAEELQSIEATLVKSGCRCLFVDAGSSIKRFFDGLKQKSEEARLAKMRQRELLAGARDAKEVDNADVPRGMERKHMIIGGAFGAMLLILLAAAFGPKMCGSSEPELFAEDNPDLPGLSARAGSPLQDLIELGGLLSSSDSQNPIFTFIHSGLTSMHPKVFPERVRAYVPGTGPWARWMVRAREGRQPEPALLERMTADEQSQWPDVPLAHVGSLWAVKGVEDPQAPELALAIYSRLSDCLGDEPEEDEVATRGLAARRWSASNRCEESEDECLDAIGSAGCSFFLEPLQSGLDGATLVLRAITESAARCYVAEELPLTEQVTNNLAAWGARMHEPLFDRFTWEHWTEEPATWQSRAAAIAAVDCEEFSAWLSRRPSRQADHILGIDHDVGPAWDAPAAAPEDLAPPAVEPTEEPAQAEPAGALDEDEAGDDADSAEQGEAASGGAADEEAEAPESD